MASFDGKFIRGITGDVIFRKQGDQQIIQGKSKKTQIDMTAATYDAAFIFGRASTMALYIRAGINPILRHYDSLMVSRLTGQCNQILQSAVTGKANLLDFSQDYFSRLNGFECNMESPVKNYLFAQPLVSFTEEVITIDLPEMRVPQDLKFPVNASFCMIAISVTLFDLDNDQYKTQEIQSFEIDLTVKQFTAPAQQLNFEASPGALCVIALGIYYFEKTFAGNAMINNKSLSPSAILRAEFCPGLNIFQEHWIKMEFNQKKTRKKLVKKKKPVAKKLH